MHSAIEKLQNTVEGAGLTMTEAAVRWVVYHSALGAGDGIILGASKPRYLEQNTADIAKGPLPTPIVDALSGLWSTVEKVAPFP